MQQTDLVIIKQLPIIEERLRDLSSEIEAKAEDALSLAVTPDTVTAVKKVRAELNKERKEFEAQRKAVRAAIMEPYNTFDEAYQKYVGKKYEETDAKLKGKIDSVESALKEEKLEDLEEYFDELAAAKHLDWLTIDRAGINITLSKSMTALKKEVDAFVGHVSDAITAIDAMPDAIEVLAEYKQTLDLGGSIAAVKARREAIEQEREAKERLDAIKRDEAQREKEVLEAAKLAAPIPEATQVVDDDPVRTLSFTVTAPISKLRALKEYLTQGGYQIG